MGLLILELLLSILDYNKDSILHKYSEKFSTLLYIELINRDDSLRCNKVLFFCFLLKESDIGLFFCWGLHNTEKINNVEKQKIRNKFKL